MTRTKTIVMPVPPPPPAAPVLRPGQYIIVDPATRLRRRSRAGAPR